MLNYETLLSSYDDKLTLMQWLKKVEEALKDASATSFDVIKTGNATLKFAITFEDGTSLVSGEIVLQQGESVASGEIRNGHLFLTLTNGQELDCGLLFNGEVPSLEVRSLEVTGGLIVGDDANAAIGGDLVVHGLTEVQNLLAYGHVETGTLTAAGDEIKAEKPVIETMEGYSFSQGSIDTNVTKEFVYAGAVKNGNKLTLVIGVQLTNTTGTQSSEIDVGHFYLPASIMSRLYEVTLGTYPVLASLDVKMYSGVNQSISANVYIEKFATFIKYNLRKIDDLVQNRKYYLRIETTLLLSENLAA